MWDLETQNQAHTAYGWHLKASHELVGWTGARTGFKYKYVGKSNTIISLLGL